MDKNSPNNSAKTAKPKQSPVEAWQHVQKLIKDAEIAMLTTVDTSGFLKSRPMMTQESKDAGILWFFSSDHHGKAEDLERDPRVNVSYSLNTKNQFVSISGLAELVHDDVKKKELWKPSAKTWFPEGMDDPHAALLKVYIEKAEYWDAPVSAWVEVIGFAKAVITGHAYRGGAQSHDTINLAKSPEVTSAISSPS